MYTNGCIGRNPVVLIAECLSNSISFDGIITGIRRHDYLLRKQIRGMSSPTRLSTEVTRLIFCELYKLLYAELYYERSIYSGF